MCPMKLKIETSIQKHDWIVIVMFHIDLLRDLRDIIFLSVSLNPIWLPDHVTSIICEYPGGPKAWGTFV